MARKFAEIAFTPSVKAAQERYGSRAANRGHEMAEDRPDVLGAAETAFIQARDGFYQATVSETGWPYVQFRGGPAGFLKVLDERTIGYADFRGNIQYLSVGNLTANDRIALILMDYPNRRRLKVWARARIVHRSEDPELLDRLEVPTYRARVERAVVLTVEALDWNCPQHITPRFTESEVEEMVRPLTDRMAELEAAAPDALPVASGRQTALGDGPLDLVVTGIRQLTPEVRAYEFRRPDFGNLPAAGAGSHILVPVPSQNGRQESRAYSITSDPGRRDAYEIAVRLDPDGRGGSRAIHAGYALGTRLRASRPRNTFALHRDDRPAVLIAGGIGITPLKAMAQALQADGRRFHLHYAARSRALMAYRPELAGALEDAVSFYDTAADQRLDIEAVLSDAALEAVIYVCGPPRLIDAVRGTAFALGIALARVVHESFGAAPNPDTDTAFEVRLERSGTTLQVAADETILDTLIDAGVATDFECRSGTCGTCAIKVLEGEPLHRDSALTDAERDQAGLICTCVSRAASDRLMLDL